MGQEQGRDSPSAPSLLTPQEHQKVELLRKAVDAHRAYTNRVSELGISHLPVHSCSKQLLTLSLSDPSPEPWGSWSKAVHPHFKVGDTEAGPVTALAPGSR